jgi:probable HAF family extracellular repeat protein
MEFLMNSSLLLACITAAAVPIASPIPAAAQSFTGLGHLPGVTYSYGFGVSGDGLAAVGWSDRAFRWTAAGGMQDLGTMGGIVSQALAVSDGGVFVTGNGDLAPPARFYNAFRWSAVTGMQSLGSLGAASYGLAISADGSVVVGRSVLMPSGDDRAFRWTAASGMQDLGTLAGDFESAAQGVSADGSVVVGYSVGFTTSRAFRWTSDTGMVELGFLPGGHQSYAFGVSRDGSVVAGWGTTGEGSSVAFRWTAEGGMVPLGVLPTGSGSFANAISGDGTAVVGRADAAGFPRAFLWTAATGLVDLNTYLPTLGINLTGWTLTTATGVATDGRTIVGTGTHNGTTEAWMATLGASCAVDFNADGDVNVQDFLSFLAAFAAADPRADFDASGAINVQDFLVFLASFASGC